MDLWITKLGSRRYSKLVSQVRAVHQVMEYIGAKDATMATATDIITALRKTGEPQKLGLVPDDEIAVEAIAMLLLQGMVGTTDLSVDDEDSPSEIPDDFAPSYEACKQAMILLTHVGGNPTAAWSAAASQARVLEKSNPEFAALMRETAMVITDTFVDNAYDNTD